MRFFSIILIVCLTSFNLNGQKIATFKFSYILENLLSYKNFINQLDEFKKKKFNELQNEENALVAKLNEIEESKILLSEKKYLEKISEFDIEKQKFEKKVSKLNNYLNENLEKNENIILIQVVNIAKKIAIEKNIEIIFSDDQYFLALDNIDISEKIFKELNILNINLQLLIYE